MVWGLKNLGRRSRLLPWCTKKGRVGANLAISRSQLPSREVGQMSRVGRAHVGVLLLAVQEQGQDLDGLAQAHVVGQDAAQAQAGQAVQPGQAAELVGAELALEARGLGDGLVGQDLQVLQGGAEVAGHFHLDGLGDARDVGGAGEGGGQGLAPAHALEAGAAAGLDDLGDLLEGLGVQGHPLALPGHQGVLEAGHLGEVLEVQGVVAQHEGPVRGDRAVQALLERAPATPAGASRRRAPRRTLARSRRAPPNSARVSGMCTRKPASFSWAAPRVRNCQASVGSRGRSSGCLPAEGALEGREEGHGAGQAAQEHLAGLQHLGLRRRAPRGGRRG